MKYTSIANYEAAGHEAVQIKIDNWGELSPKVTTSLVDGKLTITVEVDARTYMVQSYTGEFWTISDKVVRPVGFTKEQYLAEHPDLDARDVRIAELVV